MGQENEYVFEDDRQLPKKSKLAGVGKFIWNSKTKEFLGRDGASWGKVSLFYAIFYLGLGSFFIGMLAVFIQIMPKDKPTYYAETSIMNSRGAKLNPGLGFRPQTDVEDSLIYFSPNIQENENFGYKRQFNNLKNFLHAKYPALNEDEKDLAIKCEFNNSYVDQLNEGKFCKFDYAKIFEKTECTEEKSFGFTTKKPCILIKLNKIVSWTPQSSKGYISIKCKGETAIDQDNVKGVTYHSEDSHGNIQEGRLENKYYPFISQKGYRAPFIFVQLEVTENTLVNVECIAEADNIDYERLNKRGLTKFSLFISNKK